ncbi:MAG TPA: bifunctional phosphoribosylaminoimidazolecarboxamide formyltransferase/IMP cyclohydrolase, partial [Casimicrobiaceae bacterium]|nr:bifunctional phosphoribosylaminoimidazolecarboxamide formyltransferase/IMP cyclohydrolase [Casimicrobiaceae bacterium]
MSEAPSRASDAGTTAVVARALLSVSDKSGIVELACGLAAAGIALLSTGGTAKALADAGIAVTDVGSYTGFPEMLDGRVKTLHPKVHGGILARRDIESHRAALAQHSIPPIDLVVVNLYPFRETVAKPGCTLEDAIENIDIGGPAMVRSAAKNWMHVGIVVEPADYQEVLAELRQNGNALSAALRFRLMQRAFAHTASYDTAIAAWLAARDNTDEPRAFPQSLAITGDKREDLRYGENPHQRAALYREPSAPPGSLATYRQLQGKELSYNNVADADAAWTCVSRFPEPTC